MAHPGGPFQLENVDNAVDTAGFGIVVRFRAPVQKRGAGDDGETHVGSIRVDAVLGLSGNDVDEVYALLALPTMRYDSSGFSGGGSSSASSRAASATSSP